MVQWGSEVRTIQDKLKRWGYYTGNVDGIYGSLTVSAVKKFQQKMDLLLMELQEQKHLLRWE